MRLCACLFAFALLVPYASSTTSAACPPADLTGDCFVDLQDFAQFANQWLTGDGISGGPAGMQWVYVDDPGVEGHEGFTGYMSKYEVTNGQYCEFLNSVMGSSLITVADGAVYAVDDADHAEPYCNTYAATDMSQIHFSGAAFFVCMRDGHSMVQHPVGQVSWYGAKAFCDYYGYRLPTEWEWQAVADYDGSYQYGCGESIDLNKANFDQGNPLGFTFWPYTVPVGRYPPSGYGLYDMAGNAWEWTSSPYEETGPNSFVLRGGCWGNDAPGWTVSKRHYMSSRNTFLTGFRPCRDTADLLVRVPHVYGMRREDAEASIVAQGLSMGRMTEQHSDALRLDEVISQHPPAGRMVPAGSPVALAVCIGPQFLPVEWAYIAADAGVEDHGAVTGYISKYETTNGQYCRYLNEALAAGAITVVDGVVYAADDGDYERPYFATYDSGNCSQIHFDGHRFTVRIRDGYTMINHPVVEVSWHGAKAFCDYYGYTLPTEWQWQAVADYDGSYGYGCGTTISPDKANYGRDGAFNVLGLSASPYTTPVGFYPPYGYGVCDMAGNVLEWTKTVADRPDNRVVRGGYWASGASQCAVFARYDSPATAAELEIGFRVFHSPEIEPGYKVVVVV